MLSCTELNEPSYLTKTAPDIPWSCSGSGAVAQRSNDMRSMFPSQENPYFDSDNSATP